MRKLVILLGFALALPLQATVFTVTKTADTLDGACDGDCSLREAVTAANNGGALTADVVVIPAGIYRLTLAGAGEDGGFTGDLDLYAPMILVGAGPGSTVLSGGGLDRVLDVRAAAEIYGVTIRDGRADGDGEDGSGGGILVRPIPSRPPVVLRRSAVIGNLAQSGGGIAAFGFLEVGESAILENHAAEGDGGGIAGGGTGTFSLRNVTVSGNRASGSGGGLDYRAEGMGPVSGTTIVFNHANVSGGGIHARGTPSPRHVFGSIVAQNSAPASPDCLAAGPASAGSNVFGTPGCSVETDRTGTAENPLRAVVPLPRTDLGPTRVHELLPDSPALDLVPNQLCEPADQVGQARTPPCDAGAWEKVEHPACVPGGAVLCMQEGRFRVSALWTLDERLSGSPATAFPLTDDTGIHWFFGPDNLEVMTKVLDGCGLNGHWWVFTSGLTDVGVTLRVEDLKTGRIWEHAHPKGQTYAPRLDVEAFPCDLADARASVAGASVVSAPDLAPSPNARVLRVTRTGDSDDGACNHDCSLREAVLEANLLRETTVVVLGPGVHPLSIPGAGEDLGHTGDLDVTGKLVILGAGADRTVIDGGGLDRVLDVDFGGFLELHGVTVTGGWARSGSNPFVPGDGGGIRSRTYLGLARSAVRDNRADREGGGIFVLGGIEVRDSTVSGNVAAGSGGGISAGSADLENVTLSGNRADGGPGGGLGGGGGILSYGRATLRNVTATGNSAVFGGGIALDHICNFECPPILFELQRTVIAGNARTGPLPGGDDCSLEGHTGGFNLFGIGNGCFPGETDLAGTPAQPLDPRLAPLGDHGGPMPTHALLPDSPALDLAPACSGADQRGRPRPADGDGDGAALCDAGAVERQPGCQPDAETLCLGAADRFRVTARWTAGGNSGPGRSVPLAKDTGSFWFFDPANLEITVKVLDGCGLGGHWWVFLSGLTDVGVEVEVEDTATGNVWTHARPAGTPLQPRLDTEALPCGSF